MTTTRLARLAGTAALLASCLGFADSPPGPTTARPPSVRDNPRWQQAKPHERAHLTAFQTYRLTVDVGCAVRAVLVKLRASKDELIATELAGYEQAWVELGTKLWPDAAFVELNKKFPKLALALEKESLTWRDVFYTAAQVKLGAATVASQKPGAKPPFFGDVSGAGEYLWNYGDGVQACGLWTPPLSEVKTCDKAGTCETVTTRWSELRDKR